MIISSLRAENLLKYKDLRLNELPQRGVIAVSGDNESGKSAIGEIICFALFGRTYSLAPGNLHKLVRWGATEGWVALRFNAKDQDLEIIRHIDQGSEQSARLLTQDQAQDPIARGTAAVTEQIEKILGYDFDEYVDTFYLAQREITAPHPHSPSVKAMAGITPFEQCAAEMKADIERDETSARLLDRQKAELEGQLTVLDPPQVRLEAMEQELAANAKLDRQLSECIRALGTAARDYSVAHRDLRSQNFRQGLARFLEALVFVLLVAAIGVWALYLFGPAVWQLPAAGLPLGPTLAYVILALAGALLLTWLWSFTLNLGIRKRHARARRFAEELRVAEELERADKAFATQPNSDPLHDDERSLRDGARLVEGAPLADKPQNERRRRLAERILALEASPDEVRAAERQEITWIERGRLAIARQRESLSQALACAKHDKERALQLRQRNEELAKQLDDCGTRTETARLALSLVNSFLCNTMEGFNKQLRQLVSRTLPRFTDGHYEYLQLGDDLQVRVYSADKRSFLDLEEISSGTQRQIMLALRLALAQEQLSRTGKEHQFAFLDEPFAFFDDTRMRGALRQLSDLSELITQYWVVAQRFPRDEFLALEIPCVSSSDTLKIGMDDADLDSKRGAHKGNTKKLTTD